MKEEKRSKLVSMTIRNIGCIGNNGLEIKLDKIVCLVGKNNSGKSTILRAYELAKGSVQFNIEHDRYQLASIEQPSEIILEVHIPKNIGNVDERWKTEHDGLLIVKSIWRWEAPDFQKVRKTWDPQSQNWADDGKAGGADPVFSSRLPRPLRIGSLEDADKTQEILLNLALTPLVDLLKKEQTNNESEFAKALINVTKQINALSTSHQEHFNKIAERITSGFQNVFPNLHVRLNIATAPLTPNVPDLIKKGSGLRINDGNADTSLNQQGTGTRRALFWAMLQVHNELTREKESREKQIKELTTKLTKTKKKAPIDSKEINELQERITSLENNDPLPNEIDDPALPGYLLLIDEPENALHPMAARAAQQHLYSLAEDPDWQVMITTHSPYFINPFEDHTTIVRLDRPNQESSWEPKIYRSDTITFEEDEKQRLQALQHIDPSFAEIFFGSYPILVEGDTEHAAFIAAILEKKHELMERVTIIRARGKAILVPLIKVLKHFKIDFGILHDCDSPYTKSGNKNGMWTENGKIRSSIISARDTGLTIRHRVSFPDFERFLGYDEESKDKPLNAYRNITTDTSLCNRVQELLEELINSDQYEPFSNANLTDQEDYNKCLLEKITQWAKDNGNENDIRYKGK
ncbi:TPA: AAA family ATPase [Legionella pneumophila subsp. pneumophila]|uniref:ATP-dependent nuclease n=1 Tax=Legionella pneumophila TaxID=446 RepID=UPI0001527970|nr:AAA family ATPase [Legionella pneumophila]HAT8849728.1 AAA family ATPase [Legionella pneumophila subsp. pneumophila]ABQ56095.1 hypothetical protein LPC_2168 [Legionella pneumophila str. Corby]ADG24461.1 hypothetical protein lpa_01694 [Legionella pneumophila 2300/99 Alcoy]MCK1859572.1 ATP-dependent endonuclease [Legionella pneumophila]MCO1451175.1 ATP-dependent endonuclease [Legionella pneumophila]